MDKCIVYGVRTPYVHEVIESILRSNVEVGLFIDNLPDPKTPLELNPLVTINDISQTWLTTPIVFGTITPGYRKVMYNQALALGFTNFMTLVDPTSIVSSTAHLSQGVQLNAAVVVGANTILNDFSLVNRSASIGHDVVLEAYATLGPACILCGSSTIGTGSFIGAGAIITPRCSIGKNSIVGAGAVVTKDVPDNCIVVGNPARVSKTDIKGYNGTSV